MGHSALKLQQFAGAGLFCLAMCAINSQVVRRDCADSGDGTKPKLRELP